MSEEEQEIERLRAVIQKRIEQCDCQDEDGFEGEPCDYCRELAKAIGQDDVWLIRLREIAEGPECETQEHYPCGDE